MENLKKLLVSKCPECDSPDLVWHSSVDSQASGVVNGRLRESDVIPVFYLGCEECSATVKQVRGDDLAYILTSVTV